MLLGERYYDPSTGRFISRDPIGYGGGENLYQYCENNPLNGLDPAGHDTIKHNGQPFRSKVGDADVQKGRPHWDGPNGQWIGKDGILRQPGGRKTKLPDRI